MATSFFFLRSTDGHESCTEYDEVKTPHGTAHVNSWHTQGLSSNNKILPVCQLVREKLTRKDDLPIHIGDTGYIHLNDYKTTELPDCWTVDDLDRTVFVFENNIYFQRYKSGGCVVCRKLGNIYSGWDAVPEEEEQVLISKLKSL